MRVGLDAFARRQFDSPNYQGTKIEGISKDDFLRKVNELLGGPNPPALHDGYAPFCKHIFVENFTTALPGAIAIDAELQKHLRSGYCARRPEELAVLSRWVMLDDVRHLVEPAKFLDLILYSREQIAKEAQAMSDGKQLADDSDSPPYSIISIKAQNVDHELPMAPITMMRNAIISEGGSGVEISREKYARSVEYWEQHCEIRA